jgi:hypothetical protein
MADNNNSNRKKEKFNGLDRFTNSIGSLARSAIVALPLGLATRDLLNKVRSGQVVLSTPGNFAPVASSTLLDQVMTGLREFPEIGLGGMRHNTALEMMGKLGHAGSRTAIEGKWAGTILTKNSISSAWSRAARNSGLPQTMIDLLLTKIQQAKSGAEAIKDISMVASGNQSVYMKRAIDLFLDDVRFLEDRAGLGVTSEISALNKGLPPYTKTTFAMSRLPQRMQGELREMASLLGVSPKLEMITRHDASVGKMLKVSFFGGKLEGKRLAVNIPLSLKENRGTFVHGTSLQSKYVAGQYGIVEEGVLKDVMRHEEWGLYRMKHDLIPSILNDRRITQSKIRQMTNALEMTLLSPPEWVENIPSGVHKGLDEYIKHRSQVLRLYAPGGGQYNPVKGVFDVPGISETEYYSILGRGHLPGPEGPTAVYPGFSPTQIAHNVVSTIDPRKLHPVLGDVFPFVRRPMQFLRRSYAPTSEAMREMSVRNPLTKEFAWAKLLGGVDTPLVRTMYISERHAKALSAAGIGTQGTIAISSDLSVQRATAMLQPYDIGSETVSEELKSLLPKGQTYWELNKEVPEGMFLGYDPMGKPISLPQRSSIISARLVQDKNKHEFLQLNTTKELEDLRWSKVFGGGKGMAGEIPTARIQSVIGNILGRNLPTQDYMAIVSMGELKKNRMLHYQQLFTALWDHSKANMQSGKTISTLSSNFLKDPLAIIAQVKKKALHGDKYNHEMILRESMRLARGGALTPSQMGEVFGAVPDVFGLNTDSPNALMSEWSASMMKASGQSAKNVMLSQREASEILRGGARSITQFFFEGLGGPGAGSRGTIEPRFIDILDNPWWGKTGQAIQGELIQRMGAEKYGRILEQEFLGKSLASMIQPKTIAGSITASSVVGKELWDQGFSMNLKGIGDIVVPPAERMSQLASYTTASSLPVTPDLALDYKNFVEQAQLYEQGKIPKEAMRSELDTLIGKVSRARTGTVSGKGGLLRGELPGSRFLTSVTALQKEYKELGSGVSGITESSAEAMFRDLSSFMPDEHIEQMRKTFSGGGKIPGMIMRHPGIGPYSIVPTYFQKVSGARDVIVMPEIETRGALGAGQLSPVEAEQFAALTKRALNQNEAARKIFKRQGITMLDSLRLGPAVGLADDFDADIVSAIMVSPESQKLLEEQMAGMGDDYTTYSLRMQLLKSKAKKGTDITIAEAIADDSIKLGATQRGRLGQLSNTLSATKAAVLSQQKTLGKAGTENAMFLLEWLEQTPISAKHIAPGEAVSMIDTLTSINESVRYKDTGKLVKSVENIMSSDLTKSRGSLLREGATLAMEEGNKITTRFIPGIDIEKTASNIINSIKSFETMEVGGIKAPRLHELLAGKGSLASPQEAEVLLSKGIKHFNIGRALNEIPIEKGIGAKLSEHYMSFTNQLGAAGKGLLPHAKPLALGFAASVALSSLLSPPPLTVSPQAMLPPRADMRSGSGGMDQPMHPQDYPMGSPRTPPSIPPGRAFVTNDQGANIRVRGRSNSRQDYSGLNSSLNQVVPGSNVRSQINDNRRSLTSRNISHILRNG